MMGSFGPSARNVSWYQTHEIAYPTKDSMPGFSHFRLDLRTDTWRLKFLFIRG